MLLHSWFDVIILIPHAHLDAVSGVVTFAANWKMSMPGQNNHNNMNNSYCIFSDSSSGWRHSLERNDSQMHNLSINTSLLTCTLPDPFLRNIWRTILAWIQMRECIFLCASMGVYEWASMPSMCMWRNALCLAGTYPKTLHDLYCASVYLYSLYACLNNQRRAEFYTRMTV